MILSILAATMLMLILMLMILAAASGQGAGAECVIPPYFALNVQEDIPSEQIESLTLEGRCFLACQEELPDSIVNLQ